MKVLVFGLGRSGGAVAELCLSQGHEVSFCDRRERGPDIARMLASGVTRHHSVGDVAADICVAAPGVPIDHPELVALRARGVETIGEVEWVYRTVPGTYLGITGTAGKGTTTSWLQHLLAGAGVDAVAGGNLDPALAAVARPGATMVVELSSFQLERCPSFRPALAAILNLGSDHLDRHGTVAAYHATKRRLLANLTADDVFIYGADHPLLAAWAAATPARSHGFSTTRPAAAWLRDDGWLVLRGTPLIHRGELLQTGKHQLANALATALAAAELGLDESAIAAGLADFPGLPGRYAEVAVVAGVRFIDDSIATRPLAVEAALEAATAPVVWIAGGVDKGADLERLQPLVAAKVALLIGIGQAGPAFAATFAAATETRLVSASDGATAMRSAVRQGFDSLVGSGGRGTVLLAPLGSSFDQFRDYRDRAEVFRQAVQEVEDAWTLCC